MKKRILSLVVTLVLAVSVLLGVSLASSAAEGDGLKDSAISLAENVTLKMEVAIAAPTEGAYAKITVPCKDGNKVDATQLVAAAPKSGDNYVFFAEVAVKDLAKNVTIEICDAEGNTLVAAAPTSALAYCERYLALDGENEFDGLVEALVAYATAADFYFDPAKTADTAITPDFTGVADAAFDPAKLPEGITHRSATLLLESETTIRHYFELAEGKSADDYTFFVDLDKDGACDVNEKLAPKTKTAEDGKTVYYVDIANLTPNMLDEAYTVGVEGKADGKVYTCTYGVLTYLKRAANASNDAKNLAAAILAYSDAAGELKGDITFNANGGSAVASQTYEYGVAKPIVAPTAKAGEVFIGWYNGNELVTTIPASQTGDVALTAKWYKAEKFAQADFATAGFTAGGPFNVNKGVALYEYFFEDGERYTNEITLSFDILWADFTAEENPDSQDAGYFRFVDSTGLNNTVFFNITKQGVISETGDTLSKTEPTNIRLVMDASTVVYGDGVADKIDISYYVGGVYKTTKTITLSAGDISNYNGSLADYREIFAQYRSTVKSDAKITNLTITDTGSGNVAVSPEGTVTTYTHGTATKLPTPTKNDFKFAGWFADEALTQPIDEIPANAAGVFNVYPKWIEALQYNEYDYAQDEMLVASLVYCDHVDAGADGKCDTCGRCVKHVDVVEDDGEGLCDKCNQLATHANHTNGKCTGFVDVHGFCDVCGLRTSRCGNVAASHTDANSDKVCDVCGLSDQYSVGYGSKDIGGVSYNASAEWNTGYAKGVADENGGYLVIAREYGDGPAVSSTSTKTIKSILDKCDKKVLTYEFEIKKNGNDPVLGFTLRILDKPADKNVAHDIGTIGATTNGVTLTSDKFVKVAYVVDFDAQEIRRYADGVYVGSTPITYGYEYFTNTGGGNLMMRLSGTGSICIDSIGIYACDLYR